MNELEKCMAGSGMIATMEFFRIQKSCKRAAGKI